MDFQYSEEQLAVRDMMERFTKNEVTPRAAEVDRTSEFPYDTYRKLGELGVIGMVLPEEAGGQDADMLSFCLAVEELCRGDSSWGPVLTTCVSVSNYILHYAKGAQRAKWIEEYVKPIVRGEATGGTAISEPNTSMFDNENGVQTSAVLEGDEWVINGNKIYCTTAGFSNNRFVLVYAITDKVKRTRQLFLVPKGTKGYTVGRKLPKMGMRGADTRELGFADCRIPVGNMLDITQMGDSQKGQTHFHSRLVNASNCIGLIRCCLEESLSYAKQRVTWGQPISSRQIIQGWLAEMATELELCRLLRDRCAWRYQRNEMTTCDASMLKYVCAESAAKAANYASEIHGGMGFMDDMVVGRRYRDAKGMTVIQGGTPIHKWIIAQELGC